RRHRRRRHAATAPAGARGPRDRAARRRDRAHRRPPRRRGGQSRAIHPGLTMSTLALNASVAAVEPPTPEQRGRRAALPGALATALPRQARLEAETAAQPSWLPPSALAQEFAAVPGFAEQTRKEARTFATRRSNLEAQVAGERAQAESARAEIAARTRERENS